MNKKIRDIATDAGMRECALGYGMPENVLWGESAINRFAELIIRACLSEIHAADMKGLSASSYYKDLVAEHIETQFGVKE